jgi:tetratricopeptide (TPR) repeat protein
MTPLIGRDAELDMLRRRWIQACDGEMRCVLLVGEPGIGKSRVLRAFREGLVGQPHETVTLYCSPYHTGSAFAPLIEWLCRAVGVNPRGDPAVAIAALDAASADLGLDGRTVTPTIASLLSLPATGAHQPADSAAMPFSHRAVAMLTTIIGAIARRRPLAMFVEDAHWIDPSTLDVLRALLEQLASERILLLVTARPQFKPEWNQPHFVQLNLDRLSRRDRAEMVDQLTRGKKLPAFVRDQIVARTDGIPLFVEELTRTVLEGGLLRDAGGHYELTGPFEGIAIPDTLHGSLLARLDRLDPDAKEVAQIGATIGRQFDRDLVALVADRPGLQLDAALAQLAAAEIVQQSSSSMLGGTAYGFRHALIQDAAYQSLLLSRRRQYHAAIARVMAERFPEAGAAQPEVIAQHLTAAEQLDSAIAAWLRAGESAGRRGAYIEAMAHLDRGLALVRRLPSDESARVRRALPLLLVRGRLQIGTMDIESLSTFREVVRIARQERLADELADAAMLFSEAQQLVYALSSESVSLLEGALEMAGDGETVTRCRLLSRLARTLLLLGKTGRAREVMQTARAMAQRLDDRRSQFDILTNELLHNGAKPLRASQFADRQGAIARIRQLCDEGGAHEITYSGPLIAHSLLEMGDSDGAMQAAAPVEQLAEISGAPSSKWMVTVMRAMRAILHGDFAAAERLSSEAVEFMNDPSFDPSHGIHGMQMFTIRREQGRLGEVAPLIRRFVDEHPEDATWRPGLMLIASELGFHDQARKHFEALATSGFALPEDSKQSLTLVYLAEVCAALDDAERARQLARFLLPWRDIAIVVPPITLCLGSAARYLGMLAATARDWPAAEMHFEAALVMDERLKAWPWLAHTRFEYARALLARGRKQDKTRAGELRSMAQAAAERLGMNGLSRRIAQTEAPG